MLQKFGLFIALCAGWLLWSGYFKPLLLGLGLVSVAACVYLAVRMRKTDGEGAGFSIMDHVHQLATYWPWLLVEIAKSNLDVAKIVIGGAPVTQDYANDIGADGYAPDAASAVEVARSLLP